MATKVWDFYFDALLDLIDKKDSRLFEHGFSNRIVFDSDQLTQAGNERSTLFTIRKQLQDTLAPHLDLSPSANKFVELAMTGMRKSSRIAQKVSTEQILNAYTLFCNAVAEAVQQIAGDEYKRRVEEVHARGKKVFGTAKFATCLLASDKYFYEGNETVFSHLMEGLCSSSPYIDEKVTSTKDSSFYRYPYARVFAMLRGAIELYRNKYIAALKAAKNNNYDLARTNLESVYEAVAELVTDTFEHFEQKLLGKLKNIDQEIAFLLFKDHCLDELNKYIGNSRAKTGSIVTMTITWDKANTRTDREEIVTTVIDAIEVSPNLEALAINLALLNSRNAQGKADVGKSSTLDRLLNEDTPERTGLMVEAKTLCKQFEIELPEVQSRLSVTSLST